MPAHDVFHDAVKQGLIKEGWTITDDPLLLEFGFLNLYIDLAAEKVLAAEKGNERIAVEIKTFLGPSLVTDFHCRAGTIPRLPNRPGQQGPGTRFVPGRAQRDPYDVFFRSACTDGGPAPWRSSDRLRSRDGDHRPMDKAASYGKLIEEILREYGGYKTAYGEVESELIFDPAQGHYHFMRVGWDGQHRIHGLVLHVDVKNGKIWIQYDGTEEGIANRLVAGGVPKEDIVLAFHSPFMRRYTEFAVS
jgi:hypothetical protein